MTAREIHQSDESYFVILPGGSARHHYSIAVQCLFGSGARLTLGRVSLLDRTRTVTTTGGADAVKLKTSLMMLAAGSLVPLLVFAAVAVVQQVENQRATIERETLGRAVSAMSAIDAKLRGSITMLEALATSQNLQNGDLRAFHEEARRILATQPDWLNLGLVTRDRRQLMDAILPFGENAPFGDDSAFDLAVSTGKPAIGDVQSGTAVRQPSVRVRVPVAIDGTVRYVLSAPLKPSSFVDLLRAQGIESDWAIGLADRNKHFVARVPEVAPGTSVSESFQAELGGAPQGWFRGRTLDGRDAYTAYVRSPLSGWSLGIAVPDSTVEAGTWHAFVIAGGGALGALVFALVFAWLLARRIEAPIAGLARASVAMGRGDEIEVEASGRIEEVSRLQEAFREASLAVRQRQQLAERANAALEREQQALRASDTAKDQFIAMLSHELRNPLGALTAAMHLLKIAKLTDPVAVRAGDVAERQTKQMARLVEDLLDISRIVSGKANLQLECFDLGETTRQLFDAWRAGGRFTSHEATLDVQSVTVYADRARMEQMLANLLENAIKFSPPGRAIRVSIREENADAVLCVDDDGDGIEPDALPGIFDLFSQGEQGLARRKGGLGIGLAIVKRLAELQGATVEASSPGAGKGSRFTVRLPVAEVVEHTATDARPVERIAAGGPRRFLVIEDNDDMRQMLRMTLALDGSEVRDAHDGMSGLTHAALEKPDVVLIDVGLPDIDGYEVARRLRTQPDGGDPLLIALTGYGQEEDRRRATEAGFDAHLTKPVTPERLREAILDVTMRRRGENEPRAA
jgi:signal transduction histidine kinase/ActR/RegA family two-component response regulator